MLMSGLVVKWSFKRLIIEGKWQSIFILRKICQQGPMGGIIAQMLKKIKGFVNILYMPLLVVTVGFAGFGLGRLSILLAIGGDVVVRNAAMVPAAHLRTSAAANPTLVLGGEYVASKSGTKYHFPWCAGARSIKEDNKVWFASKEEAELAGYEPAANCKGL